MEKYALLSHQAAKNMTNVYSSSFGLASHLFPKNLRQPIYDIYGLVRLADELVDTYRGDDKTTRLSELERAVYTAIESGYSTNLIIQAFAISAKAYGITKDLIHPFFESMVMDITKKSYSRAEYERYIYGSAEVVGLMCLKVFLANDSRKYNELKDAAQRLGAAYQKINFLRDIADDTQRLGRYYFPIGSPDTFTNSVRDEIVKDIQSDMLAGIKGIRLLPSSAKPAVYVSYRYFNTVLNKLSVTPADEILKSRVRIALPQKLLLLMVSGFRAKVGTV